MLDLSSGTVRAKGGYQPARLTLRLSTACAQLLCGLPALRLLCTHTPVPSHVLASLRDGAGGDPARAAALAQHLATSAEITKFVSLACVHPQRQLAVVPMPAHQSAALPHGVCGALDGEIVRKVHSHQCTQYASALRAARPPADAGDQAFWEALDSGTLGPAHLPLFWWAFGLS